MGKRKNLRDWGGAYFWTETHVDALQNYGAYALETANGERIGVMVYS